MPYHWLEQCRQWVEEHDETTRSIGPKLAAVLDRGQPFSKATVSRYLRGEKVTDELTEAFALLMGVPFPVPVPQTDEQRRWCELGMRLDRADRGLFIEELEHVEGLVDASEKIADLKARRAKPRK